MSHNLNFNKITNKYSFFSVKQKAWHDLGQVVEDYPNSSEAIELSGLNYQVERQRLFNADGTEIKNFFATVRTDTRETLGVVGSKYEIVQNTDAFTFFDAIKDSESIKYETAGALGNGERIFITAKLPDCLRIGRNDVIEKYIFLTNTHDGSGAITAAFTPIRIVCNNTLTMALKNHSNAVHIKHTADVKKRLEEAHRIMYIANEKGEMIETIFRKWSKTRITDAETLKLIRLAMAPTPETFAAVAADNTDFEFTRQFEEITGAVYEYALSAETQQMETTAGTLFGAYNAVTGFYQNVKSYKNDSAKVQSIMYGTAADRSKKAFDLCLKASEYLS